MPDSAWRQGSSQIAADNCRQREAPIQQGGRASGAQCAGAGSSAKAGISCLRCARTLILEIARGRRSARRATDPDSHTMRSAMSPAQSTKWLARRCRATHRQDARQVQGPPSPAVPGKQGALPFGQQFAGLSQSRGPAPGEDYGREGDVGAASPYFNALTPTVPQLSPSIAPPPPPSRGRPPAPPPPPQYTPGGPGMFNPFRGNERHCREDNNSRTCRSRSGGSNPVA